jgi:hypothetical protein
MQKRRAEKEHLRAALSGEAPSGEAKPSDQPDEPRP